MLRLNLEKEPFWLDLKHGVRVKVPPVGSSIMAPARSDPKVIEVATQPEASREAIALALTKAVAKIAILEWEGVGDAEGNPVAPTPEGIDALMEIFPIYEAFNMGYVAKGLSLELEKNGSAPLPNGTIAGANDIAVPAPKNAPNARTKKNGLKP